MTDRPNPRLLYQSLLAETDTEARDEYHYDPRVVMYNQRSFERDVAPFSTGPTAVETTGEEAENRKITEEPAAELESLAVPVMAQPKFVESKKIVIVDTAQRDWVAQPDAYSNVVFTFGTQVPTSAPAGIQIPYYSNNPVIPYSAYEMPPIVLNGPTPAQLANNKSNVIPGTVPSWDAQLGRFNNIYGWRLVFDAATGQLKHTPSAINPGDRIVYFPPYNPADTQGSLIGVDSNVFNDALLGTQFGTQLELSNVTSIRLIRATLPVRKFDTFNPAIFADVSSSANPNFNTNTQNILNTFHTEPYLLLTVDNLTGLYYGAGQVPQNAFAALAQQTRNPIDGNSTIFLSQFQDYYPWAEEAYTFSPPLSQLSNLNLALSNSYGAPFNHLDNAYITSIQFGTSAAVIPPPNTGQMLGMLSITIYRGIPPNPLPGTNTNAYFSLNDYRPGDQLAIYQPTITQILSDPSASNPYVSQFLQDILSNGLIVTDIAVATSPATPTIQIGLYIKATIKTLGLDNTLSVLSNISNLVSILPTPVGGVPIMVFAGDPSSIFAGFKPYFNTNYPIPMMNRSLQCAYSFEVTTLVPDSGELGKIIPN